MADKIVFASLCPEVEVFYTQRDAVLPYNVIQPHQIHSDKIAIIDHPRYTREELEGFDALITNLKECAIGVRTADCVPILLFDPQNMAIAAVHSGWKGTALRIAEKTITKMAEIYGSQPKDLRAFIGPSISPRRFQVGEEVINTFQAAGFPMDLVSYKHKEYRKKDLDSGWHIDLWKANEWLLNQSGVFEIIISRICTYDNLAFHSARRENNNKCGRIINSIKIL